MQRSTAVFAVTLFALPCLWDKDTLADELRGLPGHFELVSGRWFRHSDAYYRKRIDTIPALLEKQPNAFELYDDLAVAYEFLGNDGEAVRVMRDKGAALAKLDEAPKDARYRYHANLGTFYVHGALRGKLDGFERALSELEKALVINPDAHFGRERFQVDLIRYAMAARENPGLWSEHDFLTWSGYALKDAEWSRVLSYPSFTVKARVIPKREGKQATWQEAYTAVAGMLRFGGLEGAELYRALGDLYVVHGDLHLAWWAFHRAEEAGHPAKARLRKARASIEFHWKQANKEVRAGVPIPTDADYRAVRDNAKRWRAAFVAAEETALDEGLDPSDQDVLSGLLDRANRDVPALEVPRR
ncbi:MAG: hypothetical protein H6832_01340 [Planctomycetes bacterium]|nr:hypothetical protein [Planctomycetota bacterium]